MGKCVINYSTEIFLELQIVDSNYTAESILAGIKDKSLAVLRGSVYRFGGDFGFEIKVADVVRMSFDKEFYS
ncbi:MAG: hypothetical protein ACRC7W_03210 [Fusobacteriaceae bacterium]